MHDTVVAQRIVAYARLAGVRGALDLDLVRVLERAVLRRRHVARLAHRARAAVGDVAHGERGDHRFSAAAFLCEESVVGRARPAADGRRAHGARHRRAVASVAHGDGRRGRHRVPDGLAAHRRGKRHRGHAVGRTAGLARVAAHGELQRDSGAAGRGGLPAHTPASHRRGADDRGAAAARQHGMLHPFQAQRAAPAPGDAQPARAGETARAHDGDRRVLRRVVRCHERAHRTRRRRLDRRARPAEHHRHRGRRAGRVRHHERVQDGLRPPHLPDCPAAHGGGLSVPAAARAVERHRDGRAPVRLPILLHRAVGAVARAGLARARAHRLDRGLGAAIHSARAVRGLPCGLHRAHRGGQRPGDGHAVGRHHLRHPHHRAVRHRQRVGEHGVGLREAYGGSRRHVRPREGRHAPGPALPPVAARDRGVLPAGEGAQPRLHPRGAGHRRRDGEEPRQEHLPQNRGTLAAGAHRPAGTGKR